MPAPSPYPSPSQSPSQSKSPDAMPPWRPVPVAGRDAVSRLQLERAAHRHGFSLAAVEAMWQAVTRGGGGMAQFAHDEFGGGGQWLRGGMVMLADMFNRGLAARVAALCDELAQLHADRSAPPGATATPVDTAGPNVAPSTSIPPRHPSEGNRMEPMKPMTPMEPMKPMKPMDPPASDWWPEGLSDPSSSGAQNGLRYAFFPRQRRLVIDQDGRVTQYDTGSHRISGVAQQQPGAGGTPRFTGPDGEIDLNSLGRLD